MGVADTQVLPSMLLLKRQSRKKSRYASWVLCAGYKFRLNCTQTVALGKTLALSEL